MAVFSSRYPTKQGISEARLCIAREMTMRLGRERAAARGSRYKNKKSKSFDLLFSGDPYENRTRVTAVKGRCLSRLTNGPYCMATEVAMVAEVGFEPTTFRV